VAGLTATTDNARNEGLTANRLVTTLLPQMTRTPSSMFLVAVAILVVMGHICAGPFHAHAGTVTTHSEDHPEHGSGEAPHGGSCEALRATPNVDLPALPAVRLDVELLMAILTQIATSLAAPDASPPLFLLHAVLRI
jgi:hypothetical protein